MSNEIPDQRGPFHVWLHTATFRSVPEEIARQFDAQAPLPSIAKRWPTSEPPEPGRRYVVRGDGSAALAPVATDEPFDLTETTGMDDRVTITLRGMARRIEVALFDHLRETGDQFHAAINKALERFDVNAAIESLLPRIANSILAEQAEAAVRDIYAERVAGLVERLMDPAEVERIVRRAVDRELEARVKEGVEEAVRLDPLWRTRASLAAGRVMAGLRPKPRVKPKRSARKRRAGR